MNINIAWEIAKEILSHDEERCLVVNGYSLTDIHERIANTLSNSKEQEEISGLGLRQTLENIKNLPTDSDNIISQLQKDKLKALEELGGEILKNDQLQKENEELKKENEQLKTLEKASELSLSVKRNLISQLEEEIRQLQKDKEELVKALMECVESYKEWDGEMHGDIFYRVEKSITTAEELLRRGEVNHDAI